MCTHQVPIGFAILAFTEVNRLRFERQKTADRTSGSILIWRNRNRRTEEGAKTGLLLDRRDVEEVNNNGTVAAARRRSIAALNKVKRFVPTTKRVRRRSVAIGEKRGADWMRHVTAQASEREDRQTEKPMGDFLIPPTHLPTRPMWRNGRRGNEIELTATQTLLNCHVNLFQAERERLNAERNDTVFRQVRIRV